MSSIKTSKNWGVPQYTDEENAFADALAETYDHSAVPGVAAENDEEAKEQVEKMQKEYGHAMNAFLTPLYQKDAFKAGSTDVGDVSWLTPTAQIHVAAWPNGCRVTAGRMFPVTAQRSVIKQPCVQEKSSQRPRSICLKILHFWMKQEQSLKNVQKMAMYARSRKMQCRSSRTDLDDKRR